MGVDSAFPLSVQGAKCCPGKLGKPAWVLTVYPKICLNPTQLGLSVPAERDPSHSCSVFLLLGGLEPFPEERTLFLCGSSLAIQRVSATWAGAGSCCARILICLLLCCWPTAFTFYHPNPMPLAVSNFLLQEL